MPRSITDPRFILGQSFATQKRLAYTGRFSVKCTVVGHDVVERISPSQYCSFSFQIIDTYLAVVFLSDTPRSFALVLPNHGHIPRSIALVISNQAHIPRSIVLVISNQAHIPRSIVLVISNQAHIPRSTVLVISNHAHMPRSIVLVISNHGHTPRVLLPQDIATTQGDHHTRRQIRPTKKNTRKYMNGIVGTHDLRLTYAI